MIPGRRSVRCIAICAAATLIVGGLYAITSNQLRNEPEPVNTVETSYLDSLRDLSSTWINYNDTCYVYLFRGGGKPDSVIAAFDIDDTLIKPVSNPHIPKNATDWEYLSASTRRRLEQVTEMGERARLLMFSNQHGVNTGSVTLAEIQRRIELVVEGINIPCTVFMAIDMDEFRKPGTGMFRLFERSFKGPVEIDYERSFYCGDAVGYPAFSDCDIRFAQALGLPFITPDDFLANETPKLVVESN